MIQNAAHVVNGRVVNVIAVDPEVRYVPDTGQIVTLPADVGIGWTYDGTDFVAPPTVVGAK